LPNLLNIPYGIFHGTDDELVPVSGVTHQVSRFVQLGYRHRYYLSPGYEHYSHPAMDEWTEAANYEHSFVRDPRPSRVVFHRDMSFERATEEVQSGGATLNFTFDKAYWMSELTPFDDDTLVAKFDGTSLAQPAAPYVAAPDTGPPTAVGQVGPYVIAGTQWLADPSKTTPGAANGFSFTLTDAKAVRLDLAGMGIDTSQPIAGTLTSNKEFQLRLSGTWSSTPSVTLGGASLPSSYEDGVLSVTVPAGTAQALLVN
jgi:hypothetical protein